MIYSSDFSSLEQVAGNLHQNDLTRFLAECINWDRKNDVKVFSIETLLVEKKDFLAWKSTFDCILWPNSKK